MACGRIVSKVVKRMLGDVAAPMQAVELLRAVASVDPREYEAQMTRTAAAVRTVGAFVAELAERCGPWLDARCFVQLWCSLTIPHDAGRHHRVL